LKLTFLGGADEVGASGILLETDDLRVVVDCGIRMGSGGRKDPLPDLSAMDLCGDLDAIVVTHPHLDHTGALPLLHASRPQVPVLATRATLDILDILLRDASKIMDMKLQQDEELPLYPPEAVDALLGKATGVPYLEELPLGRSGSTLTLFPAGHVLGAATLGFSTPAGKILITGDYSVGDQLTVPGAMTPRFRPDLVVTESTYGGRLHSNRQVEERRLVEAVGTALEGGGKVLIPAFALGRGQEVVLILAAAIRKAQLPSIPVWVDGMIRGICGTYVRHPELLRPALRKRILKKGENPFFHPGSVIQRVGSPRQREQILAGGPSVVVASSGMLSGGASAYYAAGLLPDAKNLICITGYQDEEAPGRRLLDLAEGRSRSLRVQGEEVEALAQVSKYNLSAHADEGEIAAFVGALRPRDVVLVHGDRNAREALSARVASLVRRDVILPVLGDRLEFSFRTGPRSSRSETPGSPRAGRGVGGGADLDDEGLERLWLHLFRDERTRGPFTLGELLRIWYPGSPPEGAHEDLVSRLRAGKPGFEADRKRPFLFRIKEPERSSISQTSHLGEPPALDLNALLDKVRGAFPADAGLYRAGILEDGRILLRFPFPQVALREHQDLLEQLSQELGREFTIHPEPQLSALQASLTDLLPHGVVLTRNPSVHLERFEVRACLGGEAPRKDLEQAAEEFLERTGFQVFFERDRAPPPVSTKKLRGRDGKMEVNAALAFLRGAFGKEPHQPRKISKKSGLDGSFLELAFLSGPIGERYRDKLEGLEAEVGWPLELSPSTDQQEVLRQAKRLLGAVKICKGPGIHLASGEVRVKLGSLLSAEEAERISRDLEEATGFRLVVQAA
jgi:Cft2 family RNA processing exonuclease